MNEITKDLRDVQGYPLRDENVNIVCYADDATLIADNEDDLQRLLTRCSQSCTKFGLKISKKTKSLIISKEPLHCKLQVYNTTTEQVTSFNYLGVQITSSKDLTTKVRHRLQEYLDASTKPHGLTNTYGTKLKYASIKVLFDQY
jgi:hypothetical protein